MKKKIVKLLSLFTVISTLLVGCNNSSSNNVTNSINEEFNIVTSFYPIYISVLNVIKDIPNVTVTNMTNAQTGCLHDYQLSPKDLKTLDTADTLVINGANMEGFIDKVISNKTDLNIIDSSEGISLLSFSGEDHNHTESDSDDHTASDEHDHEHDDNPHLWVSISKNIEQVKNIANKLSELDSKNADKYKSNADEYVNKLETLKKEMADTIESLPNKNIITFHEAFPYFADEFGLNIVAVVELEPGSEPSPKQIESVITLARDNNVKALFTEPQYTAKAANTIANEAEISIYTLDPIVTGDSTPSAIDDYLNKMNKNLETLKEALK